MSDEKTLPFDTRDMNANIAVDKIQALKGATEELLNALADQELKHPRKPRDSVLDALQEKIGEVRRGVREGDPGAGLARGTVAQGSEDNISPEPEAEDEPEEAGAEEAEAEDSAAPEKGSAQEGQAEGEPEAEAREPEPEVIVLLVPPAIGAEVRVIDQLGIVHEALIVREGAPVDPPLIVCVKDGNDDTMKVTFDPDRQEPLSWSLPG